MMDQPSILIVDDELGPRESLRMILKPSYAVHTADDGMSALQFLERTSVDLITLDLKMPGLSGMEVLERIRDSNPDVMVIIVTGYGTFKSVVEAIRFNVFDYISKPFNVCEILSVVKRCIDMAQTKLAIKSIFREIGCLAERHSSESRRSRITDKMREFLCSSVDSETSVGDAEPLDCIRLISHRLEEEDPYATGHSERVSCYTDLMAQKLGLSPSVRRELRIASYLHDIGKVCISSRFMNSEGRLSSTDWAILKRHPIKSLELIEPLKPSTNVISAIHYHHERFDGTGYPEGLCGNDIPFGARVLSIGNIYDSLTSKRPYRNAMNAGEAEAEIRNGAGSYFDPDLIPVFLKAHKEHKGLFHHTARPRQSEAEMS